MNRKVLRNGFFSQVTYYGGYSGEDPPLPIPNREVKLTIADGTDPPVGRVGSRRFWKPGRRKTPGLLRSPCGRTQNVGHAAVLPPALRAAPEGATGGRPPVPLPSRHGVFQCSYGSIPWTHAGDFGHYCLYRSINWTCAGTFISRRPRNGHFLCVG